MASQEQEQLKRELAGNVLNLMEHYADHLDYVVIIELKPKGALTGTEGQGNHLFLHPNGQELHDPKFKLQQPGGPLDPAKKLLT